MTDDNLLYRSAPGKLNLYLKITGKRSDGYHELESLFYPVPAVADDVAIDLEGAPGGITVGCSDFTIPGGTENLAGKAAEIFARRAGMVPHWDINLNKNIPVAAGMGGGSSDAAAVLSLLNTHYENLLTPQELAEAALELGADVPYFLEPCPAIMRGIGEIAEPLAFNVPAIPLLILAPQFPVSAAEAYRKLDPALRGPMCDQRRKDILQSLQSGDWEKFSKSIFNDLQPGIFSKYPILEIIASKVRDTGALTVQMTGSGPTLFAIYPEAKAAGQVRAELEEAYPEFAIFTPGE